MANGKAADGEESKKDESKKDEGKEEEKKEEEQKMVGALEIVSIFSLQKIKMELYNMRHVQIVKQMKFLYDGV